MEFLYQNDHKYIVIPNFIAMKAGRKPIIALVLLVICIIIKWYSSNSENVELGYSSQFFPSFSAILRRGLGGFELSLGDILYGLAAIWVIFKIYRMILFFIRKRQNEKFKYKVQQNLYTIFYIGAVVYIIFNLFWGINYNRKGIAWQLGLPELKYKTAELVEMNSLLVQKINASKKSLLNSQKVYPNNRALFDEIGDAYELLGNKYPFLAYKPSSIKSSMWGWLGNYAGFTGYYNPFTGEAQVNTTIPKFIQPFTSCHEVAHQLGYAKEMEANFVGYLAATSSTDTLLHYSVYLDLFMYANRNLYMVDSLSANACRKLLIKPVKDDIKEWIRFNLKHRGFLEPVVRWGYGIFLQSNEQPQGILSYDEVTGFLIAYYKKFGKI